MHVRLPSGKASHGKEIFDLKGIYLLKFIKIIIIIIKITAVVSLQFLFLAWKVQFALICPLIECRVPLLFVIYQTNSFK